MERILKQIEVAKKELRSKLSRIADSAEGLNIDQYTRFLSMQYHLTKNVQRVFLNIAGHPDLARRRAFREFLCNFANEEELHFEIAKKDLESLGREILPVNLDIELWWAYFNSIINERPFVRLGATCILENLGSGPNPVLDKLIESANFLTKTNTRFLQIHRHGNELPHGDQILEALQNARLDTNHWNDLYEGSVKATVMYLRFVEWVLTGKYVW